MFINRIEIRDLYGTREAAFEPGSMTVLTGANGSGKSSVLKAILSVFTGGSDPGAIRNGAKKGTIAIELADRPGHVIATIKKTQTEKGSNLDIRDEDGQKIEAAQTWVNGLAESLAVDPARLLSSRPKELVPILLELMPITFTQEDISAAIAKNAEYAGADLNLDGLDAFRKSLYDERTRANTLAKDADGTVKNLQRALPEGDETDWKSESLRLGQESESLRVSMDSAIKAVDAELQNDIETITAKAEELKDEARQQAVAKRTAARDEFEPVLEATGKAASIAAERAEGQNRTGILKQQIEEGRQKYSKEANRSSRLSFAMEAIDELKKRKLEELPVSGLEVRGDQVLIDGVPFEHVNTARRVEVAFQICALRVGKLPFLVIDNSECLDTETWVALQEAAKGSGFQVVAARVGTGPLSIEVMSDKPSAKLPGKPPKPAEQREIYPD